MSASLAALNMVILWTGILAVVVAWIVRRVGFLRSERDMKIRIEYVRGSVETNVAYTWPRVW